MVKDLVFVSPEQEGLSSERVLEFIRSVRERRINLHSFMLVRNGNIMVEAYYKPINADFRHRIYSSGKTLVALAVGLLVGEGKIKVTDKLIDYFPEYKEKTAGCEWLRALTIEETLTMTVSGIGDSYLEEGTPPRDTQPIRLRSKNWAESFFTYKRRNDKPNGMLFSYNTSATYILNVLVEKLTNKSFLEYLRPVFDKIGVSKDIKCVLSPDGYSWGGSGVICTLRDFAKIGEFLLSNGIVNGEQLIPKEYMERATSKQVDPTFHGYECHKKGYGYQIWMHPHGYMMSGLGGQFVYCFPDKNFTFVCQADIFCSADYYDIPLYYEVVEKLYEAIGEALPPNPDAYAALQEEIKSLSILCDFGEAHSDFADKVNGVKYLLCDNKMGISWVKLSFSEKCGVLTYENERGVKDIPFGLAQFKKMEFPETHYYDMQVCREGGRKLHGLACGAWTSSNRLLVQVSILDHSIGHLGIVFEFFGDEVAVKFDKTAEAYLGEYYGFAHGKAEREENKAW